MHSSFPLSRGFIVHVTLGQIRAFVTVASTGSFTRAADVLHLSQPALTNRVRQFEDALGLRLFDRNTRSVELTPLGRDLLPVFRRVVGEFETAVVNARESVSRVKGVIRLACLPSCAASVLPNVIRDFQQHNPEVTFVVRDVVNSNIPSLVRSSEVDFGIAVQESLSSDLDSTPLFNDTLQIVYRKQQSPDSALPGDCMAFLANRPLILMSRGSSVRERVDEALAALGIPALATCEVNYMSTAVALVQAGLGITILPSTAVELKTQADVISRPIEVPGFAREIVLLRRKGSSLHPSAESFIEQLTAAVQPAAPEG
jgi:DNA-binding transcriptional LysR family regulator